MAYDYTIQYVKGNNMFLADTFSRLPLPHGQPQVPEVNMLEINLLQEFFDKDSLLQSIAKQSDTEIDRLKEYIMHGWPCHIPNRMLPYSKSPHEYTIQAEIVYRGFRVIPPRHLWLRILHILHRDHPGIVHMIHLARQYFIDIAHYRDCWYLVFIDAYSKWVDVLPISGLSTSAAITALHSIFKYMGIPITLVSNNGTNFVSNEFEAFLSDNFIAHVCTPLGHHQSNGLVECVIQEFKIHLEQCNATSEADISRTIASFCLHHNTTPAANRAVPNSFVFQHVTQTRLSAQCTERDQPHTPEPVFVRVEHQKLVPGFVSAKVRTNTSLDSRG